MAKLKLLSTIFSKLGSLTKNNGQIIVSRDSKSLYVDLDDERIEITDWIDINTEENLLAILTPLTNKYYYTKDSNKIWRYVNNDWECLNTSVNDLTPTYTESSNLVKLSSGEKLSVAFGKISKAITDLISHISDSVKHITSAERSNWNAAKTHADSAHAPSTAQENVIETVKVNGTALEVNNKAVNVTVPTTVAQLTDNANYAKKTDIPTTLPANGGNADTVNNHTVETDVPADAVFTDTIYDDTEVKGSIAKLNSNLEQLEYDEVAGGSNIWNEKYVIGGINSSGVISVYTSAIRSDYFEVKPSTKYTVIKNTPNFFYAFYDENKTVIGSRVQISGGNGSVTTPSNAKYMIIMVNGEVTYDNSIAIIEGDATAYEPYIPSVKMLAEENAQQNTEAMDLKMLGWSVPKECPVQNYVDSDGVFHQRVGRVDLGSLDWSYVTNPNRFNADFNSVKFVSTSTPIAAYSTKYDIYSFNTAINKDKAISVWGSNDIARFLVVVDSSYTDATTFKNAMKGVYLYYELSTPITMNIDGNEVTERLNESLCDYNLNNKCNSLYQGYANWWDGNIVEGADFIHTDYISVNDGDLVTIKAFKNASHVIYYNSSKQFVNFEAGINKVTVPSGVSYIVLNFNEIGITPQNAGHVGVYVDNEIDQLKNDLNELCNIEKRFTNENTTYTYTASEMHLENDHIYDIFLRGNYPTAGCGCCKVFVKNNQYVLFPIAALYVEFSMDSTNGTLTITNKYNGTQGTQLIVKKVV